MSKRAWMVLIGLVIVSLVVTVGVLWGVRSLHVTRSRPLVGPGLLLPWRHWESVRPPATPWRPWGPWFAPRGRFLLRPHPLWIAGRVLAAEILFFLMGVLVVLLFPRRMTRMFRVLSAPGGSTFWRVLGMGLGTVIFLVTLVVLTGFSAVGLMFLPWILALFAFLWAMGLLVVALRLGQQVRRLLRVPDRLWPLDLALGVLVLITLGVIPVVGWLALTVAGLWGMGAVVVTRFGDPQGWQVAIFDEEKE